MAYRLHALGTCLGLLLARSARAAGSLDRLRSVSAFARDRAGAGPDHLWIGVAFAVLVISLLGVGIYVAVSRRKPSSPR
jgi:hypothetical protein